MATAEQIKILIENRLAMFNAESLDLKEITAATIGLSSAEVIRACEDAVLHHNAELTTERIIKAVNLNII